MIGGKIAYVGTDQWISDLIMSKKHLKGLFNLSFSSVPGTQPENVHL